MRIVCHMIASVDGRLVVSRWSRPQEPVDISETYEGAASRYAADGWIVGRTTMADYADSVVEHAPAAVRTTCAGQPEPHVGSREGRPLAVVFDPKGRLHFESPTLPTGEHVVVVLCRCVCEEHLEELRRSGVSYVFEGKDEKKLSGALEAIERLFGAKLLLLEGGGIINGSFLADGLIDELSILVYPAVDGAYGEPAIIGCLPQVSKDPAKHVRLKLLGADVLNGGVVHLRYDVARG